MECDDKWSKGGMSTQCPSLSSIWVLVAPSALSSSSCMGLFRALVPLLLPHVLSDSNGSHCYCHPVFYTLIWLPKFLCRICLPSLPSSPGPWAGFDQQKWEALNIHGGCRTLGALHLLSSLSGDPETFMLWGRDNRPHGESTHWSAMHGPQQTWSVNLSPRCSPLSNPGGTCRRTTQATSSKIIHGCCFKTSNLGVPRYIVDRKLRQLNYLHALFRIMSSMLSVSCWDSDMRFCEGPWLQAGVHPSLSPLPKVLTEIPQAFLIDVLSHLKW